MKNQSHNAILMGDIVKSREAQNASWLSSEFNHEIDSINRSKKKLILSPLTITLGDEFQGIVRTLSDAFLIAHELRLHLLAENIACRFVIGQTELDTKINSKSAWNMMGIGLSEAREKLNDKTEANCYRFSLPLENKRTPTTEKLLDTIGRSMTSIESEWTEVQKKYVIAVFSEMNISTTQVAKNLDISSNTIYKSLRAAHYNLYRDHYENIYKVLNYIDRELAQS